ncbi:MAG TPA: hypothetical protein VGB56_11120, partial [Flavisolibacter sp.]
VQKYKLAVDVFYNLAFWGFLGLTFWTSYQGFLQVSGNSSRSQHSIVFLILSLLLVAALACCAFIIKSRRSPRIVAIAVVLFLFFDLAIALPFNWLYFFTNYKGTQQISREKVLMDSMIRVANDLITPKYTVLRDSSNSVIRKLESIKEEAARQANETDRQNELTLARLQASGPVSENQKSKLTKAARVALPQNYHKLKDKYEATLWKEMNRYAGLDTAFERIKQKHNRLLSETNSDLALALSQSLRRELAALALNLGDSSLKALSVNLYYRDPTPLEQVIGLQSYVFTGKLSPAMEPLRPLVQASLITSIIVDVLPLLLSILYAKYVRET